MLGTLVWLSMVGIVNKFSSVKTDLKWLIRALALPIALWIGWSFMNNVRIL